MMVKFYKADLCLLYNNINRMEFKFLQSAWLYSQPTECSCSSEKLIKRWTGSTELWQEVYQIHFKMPG